MLKGILFLVYGFLHFQKEIDSSSNHQQTQQSVEKSGPLPAYIMHDELGVLWLEEPIPIE